jgi:hypothetical protein
MKSLLESILDVDDNIDAIEIPKKPTVSKKDYIYYLQAWYDVMYDILDGGETNFSKWVWVVKVYQKWDQPWTIYIGEEDDDILDLIELGAIEEAILKSTYKKGASEMKWAKEYTDDIINDFQEGRGRDRITSTGSNSILMALCGGDFESYNMIEHHSFSIGSKYDKYASDITKALKLYGIKL